MVELQRWRDKRGLKFHLRPANWPFNARLADGVVIEAGHDPDHYLRRALCRGLGRSVQSRRSRNDRETRRRIRAARQAIGGALRRGGNHRRL
jgi:hypothetical protein